jgi:potassium-dependent mechanosensitive channel
MQPEETAAASTTSDAFSVVTEQINVLLAYLERPDVVFQLLVLAAIVALSYLLSIVFHRQMVRLTRRLLRGRTQETRDLVLNRGLPALDQLDWPLLGLLLSYAVVALLQTQGRIVGLLFYSINIFWVLLAYQGFMTVLYAVFKRQGVARYHRGLFAPGFALTLTFALLSFLNVDEVLQIRLGMLFNTNITLGNLIGAFLVFYAFYVFSWVIQDIMRVGFARFESDPGLVNSILTITRYLFLIISIVAALNTLGFSPATLAAIAGGLSLGAGLGLQRIVGNFVSGIVLLLEQSVRPGDVVVIGSDFGVVKHINIRSTVVNRFDNVDMIIPNEELMTSTVTTYNTEQERKRVEVRVGASYNSDPTQVRKVLEEAAAKHGLILEDPPPAAYFLGFGDSSLDFVLWAWVADNDKRWGTQSDLHYMVANAFKTHGIEIPFPQRDLHIKQAQTNEQNGHNSHTQQNEPPVGITSESQSQQQVTDQTPDDADADADSGDGR